jgi:hypothetical protein
MGRGRPVRGHSQVDCIDRWPPIRTRKGPGDRTPPTGRLTVTQEVGAMPPEEASHEFTAKVIAITWPDTDHRWLQ